ncbi:MAG: DUF1566 domain-containing protein [Spirochaetae bacterium HGW-Spirochaetae-1]|nr:MAG: DUF1566 domain-containing protein [Spirochaetae bacterium HGW-Spirochaetae-1]
MIISPVSFLPSCFSDDAGNSNGKTYAIGDIGPSGAGIVFYITDGGLHGLEAASSDQSISSMWSTIINTLVNGTSPLPTEIGTGSSNTDAIIAQNSGAASAAKICRDYTGGGKTDWFLPSRDELNELYLQRAIVGNFWNSGYWSSSEWDEDYAWTQDFNSAGRGNQDGYTKDSTPRVRAIRDF